MRGKRGSLFYTSIVGVFSRWRNMNKMTVIEELYTVSAGLILGNNISNIKIEILNNIISIIFKGY